MLTISESRQPKRRNEFQQPALMFAFKGRGAIIRPRQRMVQIFDAHSRRQDPKTPVEQALMRGLGTA
jgi:hypothetical protein